LKLGEIKGAAAGGFHNFASFGFAPSFAILLRQGYEGTSFGGQAGQVLIFAFSS